MIARRLSGRDRAYHRVRMNGTQATTLCGITTPREWWQPSPGSATCSACNRAAVREMNGGLPANGNARSSK